MYADYLCVNTPAKMRWTFEKFPRQFTIHQQGHLALLPTGYLKLDLLLEARNHNYDGAEGPVFLFHIGDIYVLKRCGFATTDGFINAWREMARNLLAKWPKGKVVFRPMAGNRNFPEIQLLAEYVSTDRQLILDLNDDNIFWLSRADYYMTDISTAWDNWMFSSLRRAILLQYTPDNKDSSLSLQPGLIQSTPDGIADAVKRLPAEDSRWRSRLLYQRRTRHPFAGHAFERLAGMITRIIAGNDDSAWPRIDKANEVCTTLADTLRLTGWFCGRDNPFQGEFHFFLPMIRSLPGGNDCRVGLLLFNGGLVIYDPQRDPTMTAQVLAPLLEHCLKACPPAWVRRVIRFCLKKNPLLTRQV